MPRSRPASTLRLPPFASGQRIGVFGGSFNPAHDGHAHVALTAMKRLNLDWIWVLVTPGNPLKNGQALAPLSSRMAALKALLPHPRIIITDIEARAGLSYTADIIALLKSRLKGVTLIWLMGADNLAGFHRWKHWRRIAASVPFAVIDRPGSSRSLTSAPAARALAPFRKREGLAPRLAKAPAWTFLHARHMPHSSTAIRTSPPLRNRH